MRNEIVELGRRYPELLPILADCDKVTRILIDCFERDGTLFLCGNGGSAADAEHIAGELVKGFKLSRVVSESLGKDLSERFGSAGIFLADHLQSGLRAIPLSGHSPLATAVGNDQGGDLIFAQQLLALGRKGDVLWGISTSGNAENVLHTVRLAQCLDMQTMGLTGSDGGDLARLCDVSIRVPADRTDWIQEYHLPVYHAICAAVEACFFS